MLKIRLTQEAYVTSNGQDYHDYTDESGNLTEEAVNSGIVYYTANAIDNEGNEYTVNWNISDLNAYNNGDEDCCNWDDPNEIYSYKDSKPVEAVIEW